MEVLILFVYLPDLCQRKVLRKQTVRKVKLYVLRYFKHIYSSKNLKGNIYTSGEDAQVAKSAWKAVQRHWLSEDCKSTLSYSQPVRTASINTSANNPCWRGWEKKEPSRAAGGKANWYNHVENSVEFHKKLRATVRSTVPRLGMYPEKTDLKRYTHLWRSQQHHSWGLRYGSTLPDRRQRNG